MGKFLECFFEIGRTWKFKDGLKTTTIAKISKLSHVVIFCLPAAFDASVALFAFVFVSVRNCANCVVKGGK